MVHADQETSYSLAAGKRTIFITGDVHNRIDYGHPSCDRNFDEAAAALKYSNIAAEEGVKVTLFVTGKALLEKEAVFQNMLEMQNVELGGHGWDSFCKPRLRTLLWSLTGSRHGPRWHQRMEILSTLSAFRRVVGGEPVSWRQHAYYTDEHSYPLLKEAGVEVVSDRVVSAQFADCSWASQSIEKLACGLWSIPINTTPDHDSLEHGGLDQEHVDRWTRRWKQDSGRGEFQTRSRQAAAIVRRLFSAFQDIHVLPWSGEIMYAGAGLRLLSAAAWEKKMMEQIEIQVEKFGFATLLLHPVCMELLDEMAAFRRILRFCRKVDSEFVRTISKLAVSDIAK